MQTLEGVYDLIDEVDRQAAVAEALEFFDAGNIRAQAEYAKFLQADEDDIDFHDEVELARFDAFIRAFVGDLVDAAVYELSSCLDVSQAGIRVWRAIMVAPDWLEGGFREQPLGVCWTFDEHAAECYEADFGYNNQEIVVQAVVDPADVDWLTTVVLNAVNEEEREIRVRSDAFVQVVGASWTDTCGRSTAEIETGRMAAGPEAFAASVLQAAAA